jgi:hypothetical protein
MLPVGLERALCRVRTLDGRGAKGFYTLGVLKEVEALIGRPLCERFDLVFGTKRDVLSQLQKQFGAAVKPGDKAVKVAASGNRRNADVLIAIQFRRYQRFIAR